MQGNGAFVRPVEGGVSGGHPKADAGTLGCLVRSREKPERIFILSCNHVLANEGDAKEGEDILEPALQDGGSTLDPIATLKAWVELGSDGNKMDAAVARLLDPASFRSAVRFLGHVPPQPRTATMHEAVKKFGRNPPNLTLGMVSDVSVDVVVPYRNGNRGFVHQVAIRDVGGPFASRGDSGSLVVDAQTLEPVALVFAGGNGVTYATPIATILDKFGVDLVG